MAGSLKFYEQVFETVANWSVCTLGNKMPWFIVTVNFQLQLLGNTLDTPPNPQPRQSCPGRSAPQALANAEASPNAAAAAPPLAKADTAV